MSLRADFTREPDAVMQAVYRSINRTWEAYTEGSVAPAEFMRTPFGAPYQVVKVEGKGRGVTASRDITAGEVVLRESPVFTAPKDSANALLFLCLPRRALEAILLLHNAHEDELVHSTRENTPLNRLLDGLMGVMSTNSFGAGAETSYPVGVLLLTGSLFNHSDTPNVIRNWDTQTEKMVFRTLRDVKEGEELVHDYQPRLSAATKADRMKTYGL